MTILLEVLTRLSRQDFPEFYLSDSGEIQGNSVWDIITGQLFDMFSHLILAPLQHS